MRLINVVSALCFIASAIVQYNDPDPVRWTSLYLFAACACLAWDRRFRVNAVCGVIGLGAFGWAISIATQLPDGVDVSVAFADWDMKELGSELVRELGGLVWVTSWMVILMVTNRFRPAAVPVR